KNAPIGVFDSGLGGISVLRELARLMPAEDFLYFGDDRNAPYGVRPESQVLELTRAGVGRLFDAGCKAVVLACNTATAAAVVPLRALWSHRILIGAEPAIKPAIRDGHRKIGVLATSTTLSSRRFGDLAKALGTEAQILPIPAPGLVELIEARVWAGSALDHFLHGILDAPLLQGIDALVLGCTHYPFVRDAIKAVSGGLPLYDGNAGIARQTCRLLAEAGALRETGQGSVTFLECGQSADFFRIAQELIRLEKGKV
ncbi:MAG: glutamate racemase, partial [Clostridia bacterium]|nr:glutamate racemase [Clostridia bacterium]